MNVRRLALVSGSALIAACGAPQHEPTAMTDAVASAITADGGLLPDITEERPQHLNIKRAQQREALRFSSTHWNEGEGPLQIHGGGNIEPCEVEESGTILQSVCTHSFQEILNADREVVYSQSAGVAIFHPEHNHWHQDNVADFVLRAGSLDGPIAGQATKVTYCLIDYDSGKNGLTNEKYYFECGAEYQGISPGFGDEYHHATHGQEIDITSAPAGIYYLTHEADPTNKWLEADDTNNFSWVKFNLRRESGSGNGSIEELEASPCTGLACGNTSNR